MLKIVKKGALLSAMLLLCCVPVSANAGSVTSDNIVHQYQKDGKYRVQAYFNPSHEIQSGEGYSLTVGKNVKQAYVRAQSDGKKILFVKICGSYDSERQWSAKATSTSTNSIFSTPLAEVTNCATCTQKTYYGWSYFE